MLNDHDIGPIATQSPLQQHPRNPTRIYLYFLDVFTTMNYIMLSIGSASRLYT